MHHSCICCSTWLFTPFHTRNCLVRFSVSDLCLYVLFFLSFHVNWFDFGFLFRVDAVENETRCYGEIGCLNITREWYHLIHRPFNVFPLPRSVINTRFILYTEKNPIEGQLLVADEKDAIKKTNFNPKWLTKFIIHGFIDTPLSNWVSEMRDELIMRKNLNVIVVDWAGGSLPLYTQVRSHFVLQFYLVVAAAAVAADVFVVFLIGVSDVSFHLAQFYVTAIN